ncbi:hypothetical protein DFH06DRAFT_1198219 [Mycena polygramma]|nr:hypothetical protein DFH06DRAFT_1198219 [Mycena polygramma]
MCLYRKIRKSKCSLLLAIGLPWHFGTSQTVPGLLKFIARLLLLVPPIASCDTALTLSFPLVTLPKTTLERSR